MRCHALSPSGYQQARGFLLLSCWDLLRHRSLIMLIRKQILIASDEESAPPYTFTMLKPVDLIRSLGGHGATLLNSWCVGGVVCRAKHLQQEGQGTSGLQGRLGALVQGVVEAFLAGREPRLCTGHIPSVVSSLARVNVILRHLCIAVANPRGWEQPAEQEAAH